MSAPDLADPDAGAWRQLMDPLEPLCRRLLGEGWRTGPAPTVAETKEHDEQPTTGGTDP